MIEVSFFHQHIRPHLLKQSGPAGSYDNYRTNKHSEFATAGGCPLSSRQVRLLVVVCALALVRERQKSLSRITRPVSDGLEGLLPDCGQSPSARRSGRAMINHVCLSCPRLAKFARWRLWCSSSVSSRAHRTACRSGQDIQSFSCDDGTLRRRTGFSTR